MDDGVDAGRRPRDGAGVAHVALDELDVSGPARAGSPIDEAVENADVVPRPSSIGTRFAPMKPEPPVTSVRMRPRILAG